MAARQGLDVMRQCGNAAWLDLQSDRVTSKSTFKSMWHLVIRKVFDTSLPGRKVEFCVPNMKQVSGDFSEETDICCISSAFIPFG